MSIEIGTQNPAPGGNRAFEEAPEGIETVSHVPDRMIHDGTGPGLSFEKEQRGFVTEI